MKTSCKFVVKSDATEARSHVSEQIIVRYAYLCLMFGSIKLMKVKAFAMFQKIFFQK